MWFHMDVDKISGYLVRNPEQQHDDCKTVEELQMSEANDRRQQARRRKRKRKRKRRRKTMKKAREKEALEAAAFAGAATGPLAGLACWRATRGLTAGPMVASTA